jgi:DNA polymerase-3 subunit alpha
VAPDMLEQKNKEKKSVMEGQMSLFDFAAEDDKQNFQITFPNVEEFPKEELLAFEKETLGIYISGHPMQAYEGVWKANVTAVSTDFVVDEETEKARVEDNSRVTIGGMITGKVVKTTKTGQMMAFITLEDLVGSVEVIVFPKDYEKNRDVLVEEQKIFVQGRASIGDDPVGKLVCERIIPFDSLPRELWLQFPDKEAYNKMESTVMDCLKAFDGRDRVVIWLAAERAKKILPANWNVSADSELLDRLYEVLGQKNVKLVEKSIESMRKMN